MRYEVHIEGAASVLGFKAITGLANTQVVPFEDEQVHLLQCYGSQQYELNPQNIQDVEITLVNNANEILCSWYVFDAQFVEQYSLDAQNEQLVCLLVGELEDPVDPNVLRYLENWASNKPQQPNQWSNLNVVQKDAWLQAITLMNQPQSSQKGDVFNLDGTHITDYPSLFIALGEAIHGPCGYYGCNLDAVADCFSGGFGPQPPFHINWHQSKVAQQHLTRTTWKHHAIQRLQHVDLNDFLGTWKEGVDLWDAFLDILDKHKITVDLL